MCRIAATPRAAAAQYEALVRSDVRQALPLIQAPTLVLHPTEYPPVPLELGRYVAEHIEGATLIVVPGPTTAMTRANATFTVEAIAEFLTGDRPRSRWIASSPRCSSPTSSAPRNRWHPAVTKLGTPFSTPTTVWSVKNSIISAAEKSIPLVTDSWRAWMGRPRRSDALSRSSRSTQPLGIELRTGLHTGECEVRGEDLGGLAVHIAARVGAAAGPGEVLASSTVRDLVAGSLIEFVDRGEHDLRGCTWSVATLRRCKLTDPVLTAGYGGLKEKFGLPQIAHRKGS